MIDNKEIIELILMIVQIIVLLALFRIYFKNYRTIKMPFTIGILLFISLLIIGNLFAAITIFTSTNNYLTITENTIELIGILVLYYLTTKY